MGGAGYRTVNTIGRNITAAGHKYGTALLNLRWKNYYKLL